MRPGLKGFIIFCGVLAFAAPAQAARFTGNYLLEVCASDAQGKELVKGGHAVCQAYISGIVDYHNLIRSMGQAPGIDFCIPETVPLSQLQNIVASYINKNKDEHGSFIASPAVALALYDSYPCRTPKKKK